MKTPLRLLLCGLVLVGAAVARADEKGKPDAGKVLVLDNDRTLEGEIERIGDQYRVRRRGTRDSGSGVTTVPADRVARLCASKEEALAFLRKRANLDDPDERLRLARWCHLQAMREQALAEVRAAVELRPEHAESRRLLQYLEQSVRYAEDAAREPAHAPRPVPRAETPPVELNAEALGQFATRVQPILMNACARCHTAEDAGAFRLQRTYSVGVANRRAMQQNLAAVLGQLNVRQPEFSPFLVKAVSVHGPTGEAPLKGRQAEAFRALEDWVRLTISNNPQLEERFSSPPATLVQALEKPAAPAGPPTVPPVGVPASAGRPAPADARITPSPTSAGTMAPRPTAVSPSPTPPPTESSGDPADEFDPNLFNRQVHPDRKPPSQ